MGKCGPWSDAADAVLSRTSVASALLAVATRSSDAIGASASVAQFATASPSLSASKLPTAEPCSCASKFTTALAARFSASGVATTSSSDSGSADDAAAVTAAFARSCDRRLRSAWARRSPCRCGMALHGYLLGLGLLSAGKACSAEKLDGALLLGRGLNVSSGEGGRAFDTVSPRPGGGRASCSASP